MNILSHPNIVFDYAGFFRTDREWRHQERVIENYELIYVTSGEIWMHEEEREYCVRRGQLLVLEPNKRHGGTHTSSNVSFYWVHFAVKDGKIPFSQRFFENFENSYLFKELLHCNNLPHVPEYLVNAVLLHILSELCWHSGEYAPHYDANAERIYEWIRANVSARLTVEQTAQHFGYSPDHLSRICKKNYEVGARELINRFLVSRAKELLSNTNLYVKEIASELSFSDDKALIGFFRYHEGCSPTEFRNRFSRLHMNSK